MQSIYIISFFCMMSTISCGQVNEVKKAETENIIKPLGLDLATMSGLQLQAVKDPKQPDRKLFQKRLFKGKEISVYVVSSESATAFHESYGIDEFIYLINGGARVKPQDKEEAYFYTGDFFIAPKGYRGDWETIGATNFHHELSVISTARNKNEINPKKTLPIKIDKRKLSGIGITKIKESPEIYLDTIYVGHEITTTLHAQEATSLEINKDLDEQLIYVIAGGLILTDATGESRPYFAGDYVVLPKNFTGKWESSGHHLFRYLSITKTPWKDN